MYDQPARTAAAGGVGTPGPLQVVDAPFRDVVLATADGLLVVDSRGIVAFANPAAERVLGRSEGQLRDLPFGLPLVEHGLAELDVVLPDGRPVVVEMRVSPIRWSGKVANVVTLRDVTDRVTAQRRLQVSEDRYALSAAAVNDGLWEWSRATGRMHTSARLAEMLGLSPEARDEEPPWWLGRIHRDEIDAFHRAVADHVAGRTERLVRELRLRRTDGSWLWALVRGLAVREDGRVVRFAGSVSDVSERRTAEDALRTLALHDPLTGLANRALILDHLQSALAHRQRSTGPGFAVVFLDLDQFKVVNDSLGHGAGDVLLVEVGRRLSGCVRATDTVGRLGGDEFVVLLEAPADDETVLRMVQRIQGALAAPIRVGGESVHTTASLGVVLSDDISSDPQSVLRDADIAMYEAKVHGRDGFEVFTARMQEESSARLQRRTSIRHAAESGALKVRYQPVVELAGGRIVGFEALLRWRVDDGQLLEAESFIDAAEESGVLVPVGWTALTDACRQVARWRGDGFPVWVSVNLADGQVTGTGLAERVTGALGAAGVDGTALQLEITERVAMAQAAAGAVADLEACRAMGVQVVVDDFGTGYSSLTALHDLPLTALKIDKSFVSRLGEDADAVVTAILAMARGLGLRVVAEGVETVEQAERLFALGCQLGQGFLFGPALDPDEATGLLVAQP